MRRQNDGCVRNTLVSNTNDSRRNRYLDKDVRKRTKQEYAQLVAKIDRVLKRFTPLDDSPEYIFSDEYEPHVGTIVSLLLRGCTREELHAKLETIRVSEYQLPAKPEQDRKVADAVLTAFQKKPTPGKRSAKKPVIGWRLDLRRDFDELREHVVERVRQFLAISAQRTDTAKVQLIEAGFEASQAGWFLVVFDTRPDAHPDGSWTTCIEPSKLERVHWVKAQSAALRGPIAVVDAAGNESILPEGSSLSEPIGELIKAVLLQSQSEGVFARLPLSNPFEINIEDFDGEYSWGNEFHGDEPSAG